MTITEESRYQLYKTLEDTLGAEDANTLMEHLPPVGWADVATKADVALLKDDLASVKSDIVQLEARMGGRFEELEARMGGRFEALEQRLEKRFEQAEDRSDKKLSDALYRQFVQTIGVTGAMLTVTLSLAVAVNQLLGG